MFYKYKKNSKQKRKCVVEKNISLLTLYTYNLFIFIIKCYDLHYYNIFHLLTLIKYVILHLYNTEKIRNEIYYGIKPLLLLSTCVTLDGLNYMHFFIWDSSGKSFLHVIGICDDRDRVSLIQIDCFHNQ